MLAVALFLAATSADELRWVDRDIWLQYPWLLSLIAGALAMAAGVLFGLPGLVAVTAVLGGVAWLAAERLGDTVILALQLPAIGAGLALAGVLLRRTVIGWQRRRALTVGQEIDRLRARIAELEAMNRTVTAAETLGAASESWIPLVDELARSGAALIARLPEGFQKREETDRFAAAIREVRRSLLAQAALAGQFKLETQKEATLADAVARAVAATKDVCRDHGVTLDVDVSQAGPPCAIDPELLALAVAALVVNAAEASARGSTVTVLAHADYRGERGLIEVSDKGAGIAPDNLSLVFKPFYTTRAGKIGLGLSMAKEVVGRMGGSIAVTANETKGVTFKIRVPMRRPELAGEAAERESPARTARVAQAEVNRAKATQVGKTSELAGGGAKAVESEETATASVSVDRKEADLAVLAKTIELAQAAAAARRSRVEEEEKA